MFSDLGEQKLLRVWVVERGVSEPVGTICCCLRAGGLMSPSREVYSPPLPLS